MKTHTRSLRFALILALVGTLGLTAAQALAASPDINGDGVVNLADVGIFVSDFYGTYNARSDFNNDGVIDLADVAILAAAL